jgi:hypothetical protein
MRRSLTGLSALILSAAVAGCDLTDVELVDFTEVVVAEVYVTVTDAPNPNHLRALLHGTSAGAQPSSQTFDDALVTVTMLALPAFILSQLQIRNAPQRRDFAVG